LDGACGIYKISNNTICVELYVNKIVDGKVQRVVVLRCRRDRSAWLADQEMMAKLVMEVLATPRASLRTRRCASTSAQKRKPPSLAMGASSSEPLGGGHWGVGVRRLV
jgi:hypothetical protein